MIICSIRLKNIKSYGEGASGDGITVEFAPGINRIAGRNGHGKSTLIESLGYALFLTPPLFEETVQVSTYLLRAGQRSGEIDVTFEHHGEVYRIERGLGIRNTRRSKVVQISDGSIAAEGDHEVSRFLCRLLDCPGPERLSELFAKLVGVKQGRLAWPFDSKPTEARKHFEPLLDVEIFRQCFDRLKPVVDEFTEAAQVEATRLATITERVRDRQGAPERVKARRLEVEEFTALLMSAKLALTKAEEEKVRWESLERTWVTLRDSHEKARAGVELAKTNRKHAEDRLVEATQAAAIVTQSQAGHTAYVAADKTLSLLQEQQRERARLEKNRAEANARCIALNEKAVAAKAFADDCDKRRARREERLKELAREASVLGKAFVETKAAFETETKSVHQMRADEEIMRHWVHSLAEKTARLFDLGAIVEKTRQTIQKWDPALLEAAREKEQSSWRSLEELNLELTAATEVNRSLKRQLADISEGVCPFLKERCHQFDPAKVANDLHAREGKIGELTKRLGNLRDAHKRAKAEADELARTEAKLVHLRVDLDGRLAELRNEGTSLMPNAVVKCGERLGLRPPASPGEINGDIPAWLAGVHEFSASVRTSFDELAPQLRHRFEAFEEARVHRVRDEHHLSVLEKDSALVKKEALILAEEIAAKRKEAETLRALSEFETRAIREMEKALAVYARLDEQIAEEQHRKLVHTADHQRHIAAKPISDELAERQKTVSEVASRELISIQQLERIAQELRAAAEAVNPAALEAARKTQHECAANAGIAGEKLDNAKRELERDEQRLREFEKANAEKSAIELEISRIEAAIELTEKARGILKNAAPHVAQHLCQRIAGRAQQIFNHINHEPSELEWNSERYGLRIHPGDRRFAMLSGGEQTKLALAMTLAMIQEFCGLKFCVFDEPTYGVDSDSRLKLADAIIAAQEAAGFDQLLLVSHDDAFDGRIEHAVRLSKSGMGTQPVVE
jgi:DNA repair protein SbcC/Rad50